MSSPAANHAALFIAPVPLIPLCSHRSATSPQRPPRMGAGRSAAPPPGDGDASFARFREFTSPGGDAALQDDLVREVLWQATRTATTENMESTIQVQLDAVSDLLTDLYSRSERDMRSRNEELTRRTSLPNISKWNQTLIERHKMSKITRSEIDKELAIVDAMLRRNRRAQGRRKRRSAVVGRASQAVRGRMAPEVLKEAFSSPSRPAGLLFTVAVCATAVGSFEKIAAQDNGPSHLAKYAALSALVVLMVAHLHAMRAATRQAQAEVGGHNTSVSSRSRDERR